MSVIGARASIGTTASALWFEGAGFGTGLRRKVNIQNVSSVVLYVGGSNCKPLRTIPAVTSVASTDVFTSTAHGMAVNDSVIFTALTGGAGLTVNQTYLVATVPDANSFTIKNLDGTAVDHTTNITVATTITGNYGYAIPATSGVLELEVDRGDMLYGTVVTGRELINVLVADI
jgi:hypothetical protein